MNGNGNGNGNGTGNGDSQGSRTSRRMRVDATGGSAVIEARSGGSGRRLVIGAVLGVLVLWGSLQVAFRLWRSHYRERAAYGRSVVAPAIDPLARIVPADELPRAARTAGCLGIGAVAAAVAPVDIDPAAWRAAVADTHDLLAAVTSANLLSLDDMHALADQIQQRVARAQPPTARAELTDLWDDLESRSSPIITGRHPRPTLLPPRRPNPRPTAR